MLIQCFKFDTQCLCVKLGFDICSANMALVERGNVKRHYETKRELFIPATN